MLKINAEMPKSCDGCMFCREGAFGFVCILRGKEVEIKQDARDDDCTLEEVK